MILTTARLTLSAFTEADWPFFLALRQSPDIMRFMGAIACEEDIRTLFITRLNESHARVIRDKNNEPLGDIGLNISTQHPQEADVGYAIAPFAQGKGFASEALKAYTGLRLYAHPRHGAERLGTGGKSGFGAATGKTRVYAYAGAGKGLYD